MYSRHSIGANDPTAMLLNWISGSCYNFAVVVPVSVKVMGQMNQNDVYYGLATTHSDCQHNCQQLNFFAVTVIKHRSFIADSKFI